MKKFLLLALALISPSLMASWDDDKSYTCGYFVCVPGADTIYFADSDDFARDAYWGAKRTCEYNRGRPFDIEICEKIACVDNSKNGSRCKNVFIP